MDEALAEYRRPMSCRRRRRCCIGLGRAAEEGGQLRVAISYYEEFVEALPEENAARKIKLKLPELKAKIPPAHDQVLAGRGQHLRRQPDRVPDRVDPV